MKCVACILGNLQGLPVNNVSVVQDAIDGAKTAVVVKDGDSLCAHHLQERMIFGTQPTR